MTGWSFTGGDNSSDSSELVCYVADSNKTAQDNASADYIAFSKNAAACATYALATQATVRQLTIKLIGGSKNAIKGKIQFVNADNEIVRTETPSLNAGNWLENTFVYNDVENVAYIKIYGSDKWIVMSDFELSYELVERTANVTLTLDVNGGEALDESVISLYSGDKYVLPSATRSSDPDGSTYNFMGWSDGENTYPAGYEFTVTGDTGLTAQWSKVGNGTVVTSIEYSSECLTYIGTDAELPETVKVYYDGGYAELPVSCTEGAYDQTTSGKYVLTFTVDDMGGVYDLGEYAAFEYTVCVYAYRIVEVPELNISVKVGGTIDVAEVTVGYAWYAGDEMLGTEVYKAAIAVEWEAFDASQVGKYTVMGTILADADWQVGEYTSVTANVEVYDFDESGISTVLINSSTAFGELLKAGFTVNSAVEYDNGGTDAFLGAKLKGGGTITFTLEKMTHVILGVSSSKSDVTLNFYMVGDVAEAGARIYLKQITSFGGNNYQTIDMILDAGTYVLENGAADDKNNFSLTYVVADDGDQEYFIPTADSAFAPENTDKEGFIGWVNGTTVYTVGAEMPVATDNKSIVMYKAAYNSINGAFDGLYPDMYDFGWLLDGTTYYATFDATVAGEWTKIYASYEWINGAALRIAGASEISSEDNSAMKFGGYLTFAGNYAANILKNDILSQLMRNAQQVSGFTLTFKTYLAAANKIELNVYIEKIASQGLLKTELYVCVMGLGGTYFSSNAFTPEYIAGRAMADHTATADDTHKFAMDGGNYSYFTDAERAELDKYVTIAATQSPVDFFINAQGAENGGNGAGDGTQAANGNMVALIPSDGRKE